MRMMLSLGALVLALVTGGSALASDGPWFDMTCDMCKNFTAQPGLMESMQHESHAISDGCVMVTIVDDAHAAAYQKAMEACQVTGNKMMGGEQMHLCGMCTAMGQALMSGAKMDMVDTAAGHLMILTSADPAVIEQLQMIAKRNNEEAEKMMHSEG
ncbi:MAG: hypothetical protein KC729_15835 [Candidatus Eisenbacteria bacterium]|uniref:Copper chaperone n=1 Tax=Eiseniibacteriota bacterium TaxID=2212470 RepID=A0A956RQM6_UNCEI|nr:hypothetical protein [Candidatus Eisenbacteria bacterium]